ncbi:hypothetical protein AB0G04_10030 [Actinoplanes sp. NPDC023801]|uniref:hypothetical protein n=1 Tax=Actinoplanes sp. NPDC023801 TaxID=3154595 RepID=UPI0033D868BF
MSGTELRALLDDPSMAGDLLYGDDDAAELPEPELDLDLDLDLDRGALPADRHRLGAG